MWFYNCTLLSLNKHSIVLSLSSQSHIVLYCFSPSLSHAPRVWRLWTSAITRWVTKGSTSWKTDWLATALCSDWASPPPNCPAKVGASACVPLLQFLWGCFCCLACFDSCFLLSFVLQELWLWLNSSLRAPDFCVWTFERMRSRQADWWACRLPWKSTLLCCASTLTGSPRKKLWACGCACVSVP